MSNEPHEILPDAWQRAGHAIRELGRELEIVADRGVLGDAAGSLLFSIFVVSQAFDDLLKGRDTGVTPEEDTR